ncbi:hypothetical protein [Xanthomonas sp. GW]|uniref:hypothetical protein n=1 Tax=Xanthomonas sp. GW TaxID=2724121 RepID=UPI001639B066|nr:hypothetical protein [Xanthomonas sp. GW]
MKVLKSICIVIAGLIFISGCSDDAPKFYSSYRDAVDDNAIAKGWIPNFMPKDATSIYERHNIESNQIAVIFRSPSADFLIEFNKIKGRYDEYSGKEFAARRAPTKYSMSGARYYYRCSDEGIGLLAVNSEGDFYYIEPVVGEGLAVLCNRSLRG